MTFGQHATDVHEAQSFVVENDGKNVELSVGSLEKVKGTPVDMRMEPKAARRLGMMLLAESAELSKSKGAKRG